MMRLLMSNAMHSYLLILHPFHDDLEEHAVLRDPYRESRDAHQGKARRER